ncbi:MAG: Hsp20/alpha crystallin family protein [Planctomycetota bacterium]
MADAQKTVSRTERPEQTRSGPVYIPRVDIVEKPDELVLFADVPGVRPEDVEIDYDRGELRIRARVEPRQDPNTSYELCEYGVGDFARTFEVGEGIDANRISAEVHDGVLMLHLPKAESARTRRITVRGG